MNTQLQLKKASDLARRLITEAEPHTMYTVDLPRIPEIGESYQLGFHIVEGIYQPPKGHEYYWDWVKGQTPILATILVHDPIVKESPKVEPEQKPSDFKISSPSIPTDDILKAVGTIAVAVTLGAVVLALAPLYVLQFVDPYLCVVLPDKSILCVDQWNEEIK